MRFRSLRGFERYGDVPPLEAIPRRGGGSNDFLVADYASRWVSCRILHLDSRHREWHVLWIPAGLVVTSGNSKVGG